MKYTRTRRSLRGASVSRKHRPPGYDVEAAKAEAKRIIDQENESKRDVERIPSRLPDQQEQQAFCDELEKRPGVLARRYDCIHRERLTVAGHAIHSWLSALDGEYGPAAKQMTLAEFATAYAESRGPGLRKFESERSDRETLEVCDKALGDLVDALCHTEGVSEQTIHLAGWVLSTIHAQLTGKRR